MKPISRLVCAQLLAMLVGCSRELQGTTWSGEYQEWTVNIEFVGNDVARYSASSGSGYDDPPETLSYAIDDKLVKLTNNRGFIKLLTIDNGNLVGTPADLNITGDSTTRIVLTKQNK